MVCLFFHVKRVLGWIVVWIGIALLVQKVMPTEFYYWILGLLVASLSLLLGSVIKEDHESVPVKWVWGFVTLIALLLFHRFTKTPDAIFCTDFIFGILKIVILKIIKK